jgi:hypothetical protein
MFVPDRRAQRDGERVQVCRKRIHLVEAPLFQSAVALAPEHGIDRYSQIMLDKGRAVAERRDKAGAAIDADRPSPHA